MSVKYFIGVVLIAVGMVTAVFPQTTSAAPTGAGLQTSQITLDSIATVNAATTVAQMEPAMSAFFDQYGIEFHYDCTNIDTGYYGCADSTDADFADVKLTSQIMLQEWSKYPAILVTFTDLERIYIIGDVRVDITGIDQARAAVPDSIGKNMMYDHGYSNSPGSYAGSVSGDYIRSVIHHEYGHYVDFGIQGTVNNDTRPEWLAYNDPQFEYGDGGAVCYNGGCPVGEHVVEGFVTGYATSSAVEDYAETFAYLFMTSQYAKLYTWIPEDTILANKVAFLKNELATEVSPVFNDAYYSGIHEYYDVTFAGGAINLPGEGGGTPVAPAPSSEQVPGAPNTGAQPLIQDTIRVWIILAGTVIAITLLTFAHRRRKAEV